MQKPDNICPNLTVKLPNPPRKHQLRRRFPRNLLLPKKQNNRYIVGVKELLNRIETQNAHRQEWVGSDTPEHIAGQILDEAQELVESMDNFPVKQDAEFEVVSEIGDLLYLTFKLCVDLGIDPVQAVEMKLHRNSLKYSDHVMSNGHGYQEARKLAKDMWQQLGGDHNFYQAYTEIYGDDD
jgi:phosphoribosyl-ATP pyrophosphohydrolase